MSIAATNGTGDDWHDLVVHHEPALRRFIGRRMANRHLVDDALQETYLRAIRSPYPPDGRWLRALARRASVDVYRREPPPGPDSDPLSLVAEWAAADRGDLPGSDEHVAAIASRQAVQHAFRRLSPRHRRLLVLRGVHGLTYGEMAELEGVSPEALTSALNRARERLRVGIRDYGGLPGALGGGRELFQRLRNHAWRAQASLASPPLVELASAAVAVSLVAVLAMADPVRTQATAAVTAPAPASASMATTHSLPPGSAAAPPAVAAGRTPTPPPPGASGAGQPGAPPPAAFDVDVSPQEAVVRWRMRVEVAGMAESEATTTIYCERSRVAAQACPVAALVPGVERTGD